MRTAAGGRCRSSSRRARSSCERLSQGPAGNTKYAGDREETIMRMARSTGALSGLVIVLLGIWGALIPFVGPYFDYSFGVNSTWHYTSDRLWLDIIPGAVAVLGGLLLLVGTRRAACALGGWLALAAGTWFVIGPAMSLTWESGRGPIGAPLFGSTRQTLELVGYFYGVGALIVALAAFSLG